MARNNLSYLSDTLKIPNFDKKSNLQNHPVLCYQLNFLDRILLKNES